MASFGGANIFGTAVVMVTADNPREKQLNAFFGLSGLESLDGGSRGRVTRVTGLISGTTPLELAAAESAFRSNNDGKARTLVDTLGVSWPNVRLEAFEPHGRIRRSLWGAMFRSYQARFLHLE
jgi:hypothetical protein